MSVATRAALFTALLAVAPACEDADDGHDAGGGDVPADATDTVEPDVPTDATDTAEPDVPADVPEEIAEEADAGFVCDPPAAPDSLYELSALDRSGEESSMCRYRGDVVLIVNVAALCGFTPQFSGLQRIYDTYRERGFVVLGFYCDQFSHQAGSPEQQAAAEARYGVTFPIFDIVNVNPPDMHPIYRWLKAQEGGAGDVLWNFEKFLLSRDGRLLGRWRTDVSPLSATITGPVEAALEE